MVICPALWWDDLKSLVWWAFDVSVSAFPSPSSPHNEKNNNVESECSIRRLAVRTDVMFKTVLTRTDCRGIFLFSQYAQQSVWLWNKTKQNKTYYLSMLWYVQNLLTSMALQSFTLAFVLKYNPQVACASKNVKLAKCHATIASALWRFCQHHEPSWCHGHSNVHKLALKLSKNIFLRHSLFTHTAWHTTDTDCA